MAHGPQMTRDGQQHATARGAAADLGWVASHRTPSAGADRRTTPTAALETPGTPGPTASRLSSATVTHLHRCQWFSVDYGGGQSIQALFSSLQPSTSQAFPLCFHWQTAIINLLLAQVWFLLVFFPFSLSTKSHLSLFASDRSATLSLVQRTKKKGDKEAAASSTGC